MVGHGDSYNDATVPLFGEDSRKAQVADLAFGAVTIVTVGVRAPAI